MPITTAHSPLSGKQLRWVVCVLLHDAGKTMSVHDIVTVLQSTGYVIAGRPGKTVSDALRWEVGRGRVVQAKRGSYSAGFMQRSTEYSMRRRVASIAPVASVASQDGLSLVAPSAADAALDAAPDVAPDALPPIDLDALDASDAWSGPAPAVFIAD